ncbi:MAG: sigma-54-dependent Fis family transcriptional regulator [Planctomycetes bacterium]|nr:sigma-54-dependent Fis family transcriptional regulator [Planctomycetota bacterium]
MNGPETTPLPRLRAARTALHAHGLVQANLLAGPVARSWQRCVENGLSPTQPIEPVVSASAHLRSAVERHAEMLAHARPVLDFLHEQIRDTGSLVVLADADGMLLHAQGDETFVQRAARVSLRPGACWGETTRGTNAIGTALLERAPVVVHGGEHFLDAFGSLTCSAAPILDSTGRPLGVVDISSDHRTRHPHTLALVRSAARMIEDRVFLAHHAAHWRVHLHPRLEGLGSVGEGLVALTEDGWIVGANATACSWLGLGPGDLGACTVHGVFGLAANELLDGSGAPRQRRLPRAGSLWSRSDAPLRSRLVATGPEPAAAANPRAQPTSSDVDPQLRAAQERGRRALGAGLVLLLQGESGTGKDVFARELHARSPRHAGPFVAVNCASIPEALVEAELFGYVGGAFSGARREGAPGHFREASGGTLFLDEIGDMPLSLQTRLLRVLEDRRVVPLGGSRPIPVDVQVIAATHQDLRAAVAAGRFRSDLYYRVHGLAVELPPLRRRRDFRSLCDAMLAEARPAAPPQLAASLASAMQAFSWPGNLRQLRSVLTAATTMLEAHERTIEWSHLPDDVRAELRAERTAPPACQPVDLREASDRAIRAAVVRCGRNMSEAARQLGISRNTLYRRLRQMPDA